MKIINTVLGDATGGRWQVVLDYTEVLTSLGHEVLLVAEQSKVSSTTVLPKHGELKTLRNSGHYDFLASFKARRLVKSWKPDLIIAHCSRSVAVMKRAARGSIKVVGVSHSNNVKRMTYADAFFNISTHIESEINRLGGLGKPAFNIPNMAHFKKDITFNPKPWNDPPIIGAFGRLDPVKGFHHYIYALGILKQRNISFKAILGGDGEQRDELVASINQLGLNADVKLTGWVDDTERFLSSIDLLCVPALSDAFGLTPLDGAISSTPMVISNATGHLDMFEDNVSALFFDKQSPEQLADVLEYALSAQDKLGYMANAAFDRVVNEYNEEKFRDNLSHAIAFLAPGL
ncbi:MAG: glycosyltransferase family 4 protein [Pontibacterium sp.]